MRTGRKVVLGRFAARIARLRGAIGVTSRLIEERFQATHFPTMVTLTYREGVRYEAWHISEFLERLRRWCEARRVLCPYVWVGELQRRGAVHYHVVLWQPHYWLRPVGERHGLPKPDQAGWWVHGMSQVQAARSGAAYLVSYAKKSNEDQAREMSERWPGMRAHGSGGMDAELRTLARFYRRPTWIREVWGDPMEEVRRAPGGGWVNVTTGECLSSRWLMCKRAPDWEWVMFEEVYRDRSTWNADVINA